MQNYHHFLANYNHLLRMMKKPMKSTYEVFPIGLELLVVKGANFILNTTVGKEFSIYETISKLFCIVFLSFSNISLTH